jgi:AraC family transcriptional activator FtrA
MPSVALAVTPGVPIFDVAVPCEIFGVTRVDFVDPWYDFTVCAPDNTRIGGEWFSANTVHGLNELAAADTVIIPACHDVAEDPPTDLVDAVRAAHAGGARIASICTGAFVLAAAGLLDRRRATTHWMHAPLLAMRYPAIDVDPDVLYIDNGDVLTSAGTAAGIDLCLHIVRTDYGAAVANTLARRLVTSPHRPGGQTQFVDTPLPANEAHGLSDVLAWAGTHLSQPLTVEELARRARMSSRNLQRHFTAATGTTPLQWLLTQRIRRAQELLETTDHGVDRIADLTGLGTGATLRRHFNRTIGIPPDTYRRTFHRDRDHTVNRRLSGALIRGRPKTPE